MRVFRSSLMVQLLPRALLFACLLFWVTGCQTAHFYAQAVRGQCQILARQESCAKLLADPRTPPELRAKLELTRQLRDFAEHELSLPANGHYRHYADVGRPYVVWNVRASPRFSLASRKWWYPFVGSLSYRGYFSEQDAHRYATGLAGQGFDTFVEGVEAYSTLGWFRDPLLNTFIHHRESELAEILYHELAHQRVFASGDTDFNEAFATAVGQEAARRWLRSKGATNELAHYESALQREREFAQLVQRTRSKLELLYGDERNKKGELKPRKEPPASPVNQAQKDQALTEFRQGISGLQAKWGAPGVLDDWLNGEVNNARLNSVAVYHDLVPGFERLLARHRGDLEHFYRETKRLAQSPKAERWAALDRP
jgi:predicted aminopeptidase